MKPKQSLSSLSLRSAINGDGRRVITLWRTSRPDGSPPRLVKHHPVGCGKGGLRLRVQFAPEQVSAFQPVIRHRLPPRRRLAYPPKLTFLSRV
jgi:hypothetical protein